MKKINRGLITLLVLILGLFSIVLYLKYCNKKDLSKIVENNSQLTKVIDINDSISILKQLLYESESRNMDNNQLIKEAISKGKIKPETIIKWKSITNNDERIVEMEDSLETVIHKLLELQQNLYLSNKNKKDIEDQFNKEKRTLLSYRIPFKDSTKNRLLSGDIGFDSKLNIKEDKVYSEPFVIFGENKKNIFKLKEIVALLGDKNPKIVYDSLYSIKYKPKEKVQLSFGLSTLSNKNETTFGPSINIKKGLFHFNGGYNLVTLKHK